MNKFYKELGESLNALPDKEDALVGQRLGVIAITLYKFIEIMNEEIERAGYSSLEFVATSELFLRCITPEYSRTHFENVLLALESGDPNFRESLFYHSLTSLRQLICRDVGYRNIKQVIEEQSHAELKLSQAFLIHLIDEMTKYMLQIRKNARVKELKLNVIKKELSLVFERNAFKALEDIIQLKKRIN